MTDRRQEIRAGGHDDAIRDRLERWEREDFGRRLWDGDPTLWADEDTPEIRDRLGWLRLPQDMATEIDDLRDFAGSVRDDGIRHVVLVGMGGSSLAPEVFQRTLGNADGYPELRVLDSTHPDAVRAVASAIELEAALFVVSSKSGTTVETLSSFRYFWDRVARETDDPGRRFIAVTDPGTPLVELGRERGFRRVFEARPDVGGRYSALTHFGLVPAALIGADITALLERGRAMAEASAGSVPPDRNPALVLGATLGELACAGRDKLTFLTSGTLTALPDWIEQLIAESTGKEETGIVPIAHEPVGPLEDYGADRAFVIIGLESDPADAGDVADRLVAAGHPVIRTILADRLDLGAEMYRWEVATAAAGAILGIHPFNQPDVQLAKKLAKEALGGDAAGDGDDLQDAGDPGVEDALRRWLASGRAGDYIGIQAYMAPAAATAAALQELRAVLRRRSGLATTLGYGPRFLHSTGQLHKGGPDSGLFLQLVQEAREDLPIPETGDTFGTLIRAQADGDAGALRQRGRRLLRIEVDGNEDVRRLAEAMSD